MPTDNEYHDKRPIHHIYIAYNDEGVIKGAHKTHQTLFYDGDSLITATVGEAVPVELGDELGQLLEEEAAKALVDITALQAKQEELYLLLAESTTRLAELVGELEAAQAQRDKLAIELDAIKVPKEEAII